MSIWTYLRHRVAPLWPVMPAVSYQVAGQTLELRPVRPGEAESLVDFLQSAFRHELGHMKSTSLSAEHLARITGAKEIRNTALVCLSGEVAGFVMIDVRGNHLRMQREMTIRYIYLAPPHRSLRIVKQVMDYLAQVSAALDCRRLNWGFDTGRDIDRKRKLAVFLGFEHQSDIYIKDISSTRGKQRQALRMTSLSLTTFNGYRRFFLGTLPQYLCLSVGLFLLFRKQRISLDDFFETGQNRGRDSYLFAARRMNEMDSTPFIEVEACFRPAQSDFDALEAWAIAGSCDVIRIDTMPSSKLDEMTVDSLAAWGATVLGCSFAKAIVPDSLPALKIEAYD
jgi:hypothetical protein